MIPIRDLYNRFVTTIVSQGEERGASPFTIVPGEEKLLNFHVEDWLVLDPYGDDDFGEELHERLFGKGSFGNETLAVHVKSGKLARVSFDLEFESNPERLTMYVAELRSDGIVGSMPGNIRIPKAYRPMISELRSRKRPYRVALDPHQAANFIEREASYNDLRQSMVYSFRFGEETLEISMDGECRVVGRWMQLAVEETDGDGYDRDRDDEPSEG